MAAALRTYCNFLLLNCAVLVVSLPIVTVPLAFGAAAVALDHWRSGNEDRVLREFLSALRERSPGRTALALGVPLTAAVVAAEEVHFFARGGAAIDWACLGFGAAALLIAVAGWGYILMFWARGWPSTSSLAELWSLCARLALRNLFITGPLFVAEFAGAVGLGLLDPALALIGLPLAFIWLVRVTADIGLKRAGLSGFTAPSSPSA